MRANKPKLLTALAACVLAQGALQQAAIFPFWRKNYVVQVQGQDAEKLSPDQLLAALSGFRELTAGILWVRADAFFDEGNYDAVLPILRLVTWLDPHQIDVYATGMWHVAYNFTDEDSRSDRRYIPSAIALGKEGSKNNDFTYELFFETGWLWYHKVDDDYPQAVKWWEEAAKREDILPARRNILSMAYLRNGQVEKALDQYKSLLDMAEKRFKDDESQFQARQNRDTVEGNFDNLLVRMAQRGYFAQKGGYYDQGDYDTKPPFDVRFGAQVTVVEPRVLKVEGSWGVLPIGNRIRFIVRDKSFPGATEARMDWDAGSKLDFEPMKQYTYLMDQLFVKNQQFSKRIDMSRDPTMYPLTTDDYVVELYYNPRSSAAHMQDKFGFNGEGMTDLNHLNTSIRSGQRVIYAKLDMTKDMLERRGKWVNEIPVLTTTGFLAKSVTKTDDIIVVPGMRSDAPAPGPTPSVPPGAKASEARRRREATNPVPGVAAPVPAPAPATGHEGHNH